MNYHKRIVLDFDDTLAFHQNRDWENAIPNLKLIEKTNKLFDEGWQIDIFTARGSISCESREEAREKYLSGMIDWLDHNNVKYNSISFDKPLAAYYVDDKGIDPDSFIALDIHQLEGGLSGSDIYTDGTMVHKKDKNAHLVSEWYSKVIGINVPYVERVVGDVITMSYIPHDKEYFKNNIFIALGLIQNTLEAFKHNQVYRPSSFESYINRIYEHTATANLPVDAAFSRVPDKLAKLNLKQSFSHGDFGITNMLFHRTSDVLYLIDPIPNVFGCTELDVAKFIASLYINKYSEKEISVASKTMMVYNNIDRDTLSLLVQSELIRVYKYHTDKNFILDCFEDVLKQI